MIFIIHISYFYLFQIVIGNFDPNLISTRCTAFESLLDLIAGESRLRDSPTTITFFQDIELNEAKQLINEGKFDQALSVLETSFKLLNKVSRYKDNYYYFKAMLWVSFLHLFLHGDHFHTARQRSPFLFSTSPCCE